jgi:NitT/TauT family transport system substrate-binding protein
VKIMKNFKRFACAALAAVMTLSMVSCAKKEAESTDAGYTAKTIHINAMNGYSHLLTQVIKEFDLLTPYLPDDVTIEYSTVNNSAGIRDAIVSGNIDISITASPSAISAIENDLPLVLLSGHLVNSCAIASRNPAIQSVEDLLNANGIFVSSLISATALAIQAMSKDEFNDSSALVSQFTPLESAESLIAFASSYDVDCISGGFPNTVSAMEVPEAHRVVDLTPYAKKYDIGLFYVANADFYENNPLLIEAFRKAQQAALLYIQENPDEVIEVLTELFGIDAELIRQELGKSIPSLEVIGYDNCAALMYEAGMLDHAPKKFSELPNYASIPKTK